jgi:hypothetical protein
MHMMFWFRCSWCFIFINLSHHEHRDCSRYTSINLLEWCVVSCFILRWLTDVCDEPTCTDSAQRLCRHCALIWRSKETLCRRSNVFSSEFTIFFVKTASARLCAPTMALSADRSLGTQSLKRQSIQIDTEIARKCVTIWLSIVPQNLICCYWLFVPNVSRRWWLDITP